MGRRGVGALAGVLLSACGYYAPQPVTYTEYQLTCCTKADVEQVWRPGTTVALHLIVQKSTKTAVNPSHRVVLTSVLVGPFEDVTSLKHSSTGAHSVNGAEIVFDDSTQPAPESQVMSFVLPSDLPSGFYQLNLRWDFGGGNAVESGSVVRVGAQ